MASMLDQEGPSPHAVLDTASATFGRASLIIGVAFTPDTLPATVQLIASFSTTSEVCFLLAGPTTPNIAPSALMLLMPTGGWTIQKLTDNTVPKRGHVYIVPPGGRIRLKDGRIGLIARTKPHSAAPHPVISLFSSMAEGVGPQTVGVILGPEDDEARIARSLVERAGGRLFQADPNLQSTPSTAEGDNTEANHNAHQRMSLSHTIKEILTHSDTLCSQLTQTESFPNSEHTELLDQLLALAEAHGGLSFADYRSETLLRRLKRRLNLHGADNIQAYLTALRNNPNEVQQLFSDLLVSVTWFFREPELWQSLALNYLPKLIERATERGTLRVWVPGCGTGQEAYTLAMLIDEAQRRAMVALDVKIFATDVDEQALSYASEGVYTDSQIDSIPLARRQRHFFRHGDKWVVRPSLRRMLIFSRHNLLTDAPFIHLDILSCRNLVMYLGSSLHPHMDQTFTRALDNGGILIMGSVEFPNEASPFRKLEAEQSLFMKIGNAPPWLSSGKEEMGVWVPQVPPRLPSFSETTSSSKSVLERPVASVLMQRQTLVLIVDGSRQLVGLVGDSATYLRHAQGEVSRDILRIVRPELTGSITVLLEEVQATARHASVNTLLRNQDGTLRSLRLSAHPEGGANGTVGLVVVFEPETTLTPSESDLSNHDDDAVTKALEHELTQARELVRTTLVKLEEAQHAHRSTREKMLTANEELQSANEELHSVNQELYSVNAELQDKIQQLTELGNDVDNLLHGTRIATLFIERDLRIRKFTRSAESIFNVMPQDVGRPLLHITHHLRWPTIKAELSHVVTSGEPIEREVESTQGLAYLMRILPYYTDAGELGGAVLTFVDITKLKQTEAALRQKETQLREVINLVPHQLFAKDQKGRFVLVNQTTADFYGLSIEDLLNQVELEIVESESIATTIDQSDRRVLETQERVFIPEDLRMDRDGNHRVFQTTKIPILGQPGGPALLGISLDVTALKATEAELRHRALYDLLTGLPNRALFTERLNHSLERLGRRGESGFALLFLDLDSFKEVNDTMGHAAGDNLLTAVAARLKDCARPGDTVARFGGDEFAILLEKVLNPAIALTVAERIHQAIAGTFHIQGSSVFVSTSIGIAMPGAQAQDTEALMRHADTAMYVAKRAGPGHTRLFSAEMGSKVSRAMETRVALHRALSDDELVLYYQPILDLQSRRVSGVEVLVRWNHPEQGLVMPDAFLPVARHAGLMCQVDEWVISEACGQLRRWLDELPMPMGLTMNVNVCGEHLHRTNLADFFNDMINEHRLPESSLVVELTESSVLHAPAQAALALERLKGMNIQVALDDFGTGYSSLNHLRQLPLEILKIDRSFTSHLGTDQRTAQIVKTLVELAGTLGLKVVAEGVELADQECTLTDFGCQYAQGYLYAKPMDARAMTQFLLNSLSEEQVETPLS